MALHISMKSRYPRYQRMMAREFIQDLRLKKALNSLPAGTFTTYVAGPSERQMIRAKLHRDREFFSFVVVP